MFKLAFAACLVSLSGCSSVTPAAVTPMPAIRQQELGPQHATGLLILMPGKGDRGERFVRQGVLDLVHELAPDFDVIAADAHFGYYMHESLLLRMEADIIGPAIEAGYPQIWLLGISLGALGSLHYACQHPGQIDGVLLFGPYLGTGAMADELLKAPNLASWDPGASAFKQGVDRITFDVWRWLQEQTGPEAETVILMGYGSRDGPGTIAERLKAALPAERFASTGGGHNWWTWMPLIRKLLPQMALEARQHQSETVQFDTLTGH